MSLSQNEPPTAGNPFFHRGPVQDRRYFFGRVEETRQILEMVCKGQCVSVLGPRRIGKTSLLLHLCDPQVQREHNLGKTLFVYVDGQGLSDLNPLQFYQWLWQEAKRILAEGQASDNRAESISDFDSFRNAMVTVQKRGYKLVFLLDEFDAVTRNSNLGSDFFDKLRSLKPVVYVTASQDDLYDLTFADKSVLSSPFFNNFSKTRLSFLHPEEAREMVRGLLRTAEQDNLFTQEDFDFVFEIAGYHPFFLQLACYYLFEYKRAHKEFEKLAAADYARVQRHYAEQAEPHFRFVWTHLNPDGQKAVQLACKDKASKLDNDQKQLLERKCILYNNALFSSVFAEFVSSKVTENVIRWPPSLATQPDNILIVTVTKVETQAVLEVFSQAAGKAWTRQTIGNKTYYNLGVHGGVPAFMVQSEMGAATPGGALLTVRQAIQDLHPQAVIMCGIAFGLRPDKQQAGDILVAKQLQYYESQKVDLQRGQMPRGDRTTSAERLLDRFRSGDNDWQGAQTHFGLVLSGEKLVNDPTLRDWLLKTEPEAVGGEMEGAGLYAAARDAKVDWILVKAICDWADGKKNNVFQPLAARNAAEFVLHVLRLGGWGGPE